MDTRNDFIRLLEQVKANQDTPPVLYPIQPGDTLDKIIMDFYQVGYLNADFDSVKASVINANPQLTNPDRIIAGQFLRLLPRKFLADSNAALIANSQLAIADPLANLFGGFVPTELPSLQYHLPNAAQEQETLWALAWLQDNYDMLSLGTGAGSTAVGILTSEANNEFIRQVEQLYLQYQKGNISKGQYDYRRRIALQAYAEKIGPFEKILFKGKTVQESIRISRSKALPATRNIKNNLNRLTNLSHAMKNGGYLLTATGLVLGCRSMAQANSRLEKNEILVETLSSSISGVAMGLGLGILLMSTPVGWVTAIILGVGSSLASYGIGKGAKYVYNGYLQRIDFAEITRADQLCR